MKHYFLQPLRHCPAELNWPKGLEPIMLNGKEEKYMLELKELDICIVGANGRMGNMFCQAFKPHVKNIYELNLRPGHTELLPADIKASVPNAHIVMLSVPADALGQTVQAIAPHLKAGALLTDVTSVKMLPMQHMQEIYPGPVIGTHPLFGPQDVNIEKGVLLSDGNLMENCVVLTRGANAGPKHLRYLQELFSSINCSTFITDAEEHDKAVAVIQALNFISSLAYFATAAALPDFKKYITPSFKRRLLAAEKFLHEDADLFTTIARNSPPLKEALQEYIATLNSLAELDQNTITTLLQQAQKCYPAP